MAVSWFSFNAAELSLGCDFESGGDNDDDEEEDLSANSVVLELTS